MQRVVIAGGGIMGSASAYFLKLRSPDIDVTVLERDPTYVKASTSLAVGGIRYQFSNRENIQMCFFAGKFFQEVSQHLAVVPGDKVDINYHQYSYLFLVGDEGEGSSRSYATNTVVHENLAVQASCGVPSSFLPVSELKVACPWMCTDGVSGGTITPCGSGEGWFDPASLLHAFKKKAISLGVKFIKTDVAGFEGGKKKISEVIATDGTRYGCDHVVMACGRHSGVMAEKLGVKKYITVAPRKRYVHMVHCPAFDVVRSQAFLKGSSPRVRPMPLVVDTSGVYIRPEGDGFLVGWSPLGDDPDPDADFDDFNVGADVDDVWNNSTWPSLAARIPAFENAKLKSTWAGHYDYNTVDHNALIGIIPEGQANVVWATGFSGHGLMQSPAVGRAVSEIVIDGKFKTIDLTRLSPARGYSPVWEKNVI